VKKPAAAVVGSTSCVLREVDAPDCIRYETLYKALQFIYCGIVDPSEPVPNSPDSHSSQVRLSSWLLRPRRRAHCHEYVWLFICLSVSCWHSSKTVWNFTKFLCMHVACGRGSVLF